MTVNISDVLKSKDALLHSEGLTIFELINKAISKNKKITLSFTGLDNCSSAFLMAAIGKFYYDHPTKTKTIEQYLKYNGIDKKYMLKERLEQVIENALDPEHDKMVEDLLSEI